MGAVSFLNPDRGKCLSAGSSALGLGAHLAGRFCLAWLGLCGVAGLNVVFGSTESLYRISGGGRMTEMGGVWCVMQHIG